ncbi:MAG: pantoate--beta-alanine ligase [Bacteroidota bacterium]
MKVIKTADGIIQAVAEAHRSGLSVGFVPTMGALHQGHLSLVRAASETCGLVVVSIFVNPTQFNDPEDLRRYPRDLEGDLRLLEKERTDLVFAPDVKEIYPEPDTRIFDLHPLDQVMEGRFRPGHFNGVAQVVSRLFELVNPDVAFFGRKDFQQLTIIRRLVGILGLKVRIVGCPIIRESDGLAMSSRNQLLSREERAAAPHISQVLREATELTGKMKPEELVTWVTTAVNKHPLLQVEYFEIVDDELLMPVTDWEQKVNKVGCIAVHLGKVRLIDNMVFA